MAARQEEAKQALYRAARVLRDELNNPEYLSGNRFQTNLVRAAHAFIGSIRGIAPDGVTFQDIVATDPPALAAVRAFSEEFLRMLDRDLGAMTPGEKEESLNALKRTLDRFIATGPEGKVVRENVKGLVALKGMSKAGLPVSEDMKREVVAFLSPSGKSEDVDAALRRSATFLGKPDRPPPGGYGPGAAGGPGGPPAGGKRRKKTRKGKSKKRRYSRRR